MTIGMCFWVLMLIWIVFGCYTNRDDFRQGNYGVFGGNLLLFVLLFLLGYSCFGFPIQG